MWNNGWNYGHKFHNGVKKNDIIYTYIKLDDVSLCLISLLGSFVTFAIKHIENIKKIR